MSLAPRKVQSHMGGPEFRPDERVRLTHLRDRADTCLVPLPVRTALLAIAALAALALAAVRITHAAEHTSTVAESRRPERSATPAEAAATLAALHAPRGFRPVTSCRFAESGVTEKCFWTPRVLDLDAHKLERIAAAWQPRAGVVSDIDSCSGPRRHRAGIVMGHCSWALEFGSQLVVVYADSVFVPRRSRRTPIARKVLRYWRSGTEVRLVIGRGPHGRVPASVLHR